MEIRHGGWCVVAIAAVLAMPANALALGDVTPPESAAAPPSAASGPTFEIPYTASDDPGGSGIARVDLYAKTPTDVGFSLLPVDSDTTPDSPSFTYTPTAGDGQYDFYTVAVDNDGNSEPPPVTADGTTTVDSTAPTSSASAPATVGSGPIAISYSADDGSGVGVGSVELWAEAPGETGFSKVATDSSPDTPSFDYTPGAGDGTYYFYTVAVDALGNREGTPAAADAHALRDTGTPPPPPPSSSPTPSTPAPVVVAQPTTQEPATAAPSTATAQEPSLPLVAAVTLPGKQSLRTFVKNGLRLRIYVYRQVHLSTTMALTRRSARRLGMQRRPIVARHTFDFTKPAVYELRLRVIRRAAARLSRAKAAGLTLTTVLTGSGGSSTSRSPLTLRR
jgi:hypothetical protein